MDVCSFRLTTFKRTSLAALTALFSVLVFLALICVLSVLDQWSSVKMARYSQIRLFRKNVTNKILNTFIVTHCSVTKFSSRVTALLLVILQQLFFLNIAFTLLL